MPLESAQDRTITGDMKLRNKFSIEPEFILLLSVAILIFGDAMTCVLLIAALIHEAGHLMAIWVAGGHITAVRLTGAGAEISYASKGGNWTEVLCASGGPLTGIGACFLLLRMFPECSIFDTLFSVGLCVNLWNLLPMYPLDGGRILYYACLMFLTEKHSRCICVAVFWICEAILIILAIYMLIHKVSLILLPAVISLLICGCKMSLPGVKLT